MKTLVVVRDLYAGSDHSAILFREIESLWLTESIKVKIYEQLTRIADYDKDPEEIADKDPEEIKNFWEFADSLYFLITGLESAKDGEEYTGECPTTLDEELKPLFRKFSTLLVSPDDWYSEQAARKVRTYEGYEAVFFVTFPSRCGY